MRKVILVICRGFYSSSETEDNDTEEDPEDSSSDEDLTIEKFNSYSSLIGTELPINKYLKYKIVSSHKNNEEEEVFDWYKADSPTTYFCLTLNNH